MTWKSIYGERRLTSTIPFHVFKRYWPIVSLRNCSISRFLNIDKYLTELNDHASVGHHKSFPSQNRTAGPRWLGSLVTAEPFNKSRIITLIYSAFCRSSFLPSLLLTSEQSLTYYLERLCSECRWVITMAWRHTSLEVGGLSIVCFLAELDVCSRWAAGVACQLLEVTETRTTHSQIQPYKWKEMIVCPMLMALEAGELIQGGCWDTGYVILYFSPLVYCVFFVLVIWVNCVSTILTLWEKCQRLVATLGISSGRPQ